MNDSKSKWPVTITWMICFMLDIRILNFSFRIYYKASSYIFLIEVESNYKRLSYFPELHLSLKALQIKMDIEFDGAKKLPCYLLREQD